MAGFLLTLAALVVLLWIVRGLMRRSRVAIGVALGCVLAALGAPALQRLFALEHVPVWLPALPFALIAVTLFGFGVLAWHWSED